MDKRSKAGTSGGSFPKKEPLIQAIKEGILSGIYRAGETVPSERRLVNILHLSRPTIHEGILELEAAHILRRAGQRIFVTEEAPGLLEANSGARSHHVVVVSRDNNYANATYLEIFRSITAHLPDSVRCEMRFYFNEYDLAENPPPEDAVVVVMGQWDPVHAQPFVGRNTIFINAQYENRNYLIPDNYNGGRMLAEHLWRIGHRRIAVMYLPQEDITREFTDRYTGIADFYREHHEVVAGLGARNQHCLEEAAKEVLECVIAHREFTALVVLKAIASIEILAWARCKGVSIPEDFSLARFDDSYYSTFLSPPLTTVCFPAQEIALLAVDAILEAFKRPPHECFCQQKVMPLLLERYSTAPVK